MAWRTRSLRSRADGEETTVFTLRIPNHDADLADAAIRAEVDTMIVDARGEHPGRSRAELVESRGGWAAMRAGAVVALINSTARSESVRATDVEVIVEADPAHSCVSGTHPLDLANASAEAL